MSVLHPSGKWCSQNRLLSNPGWPEPEPILALKRLTMAPTGKRRDTVTDEKDDTMGTPAGENAGNKVKFVVFGEEMIEKEVKLSGNSGRVYLPPNWVGHHVKIIRID